MAAASHASTPHTESASARAKRLRRRHWLLLGVFGLCAGSLSCRSHHDPLPASLYGTWTTSAEAYQDRYLRIGAHTVELGTGRNEFEVFPIRQVEAEELPDPGLAFTIEYGPSESDTLSLRLELQPGPPATLRVGHQKQSWVRRENAGPPTPGAP